MTGRWWPSVQAGGVAVLLVAALSACAGTRQEGGEEVPAEAAAVPAPPPAPTPPPPPPPPPPDWLGAFSGRSEEGAVEVMLLVQAASINLTTYVPGDIMQCTARLPNGVRATLSRLLLDCGPEVAMAGVQNRLTMTWESGQWRLEGAGNLTGFRSVVARP